eukprot:COSAG02_NODE_1196_length_13929_cov_17.931039_4_plen_164_part_00
MPRAQRKAALTHNMHKITAHRTQSAISNGELSPTFVKRHDSFVPNSLAQAVRSTRVQQTSPCHDAGSKSQAKSQPGSTALRIRTCFGVCRLIHYTCFDHVSWRTHRCRDQSISHRTMKRSSHCNSMCANGGKHLTLQLRLIMHEVPARLQSTPDVTRSDNIQE